MSLLEVRQLRVGFRGARGCAQVLHGLSLDLEPGEALALVGESGSGKSTLLLALMRLLASPPAVVLAERMAFAGHDLLRLSEREMEGLRGKELALVFQDPRAALHPLLPLWRQLDEVLQRHSPLRRSARRRACMDALAEVGLSTPEVRLRQYAHELSGGMRQRVLLAQALLLRPKLLLADEPTTALDVTVQAEILALLRRLREQHGTALLLVTHDWGVVAEQADRVQVLYAGRTVEQGSVFDVFDRAAHPYTRGLLESVPRLEHDPLVPRRSIPGLPPNPLQATLGCAFAARCTEVQPRCEHTQPELRRRQDSPTHAQACFAREGEADA